MGEVCTEAGPCFPTFAEAFAAQPDGGTLTVGGGDYAETLVFDASSYAIVADAFDAPVHLRSLGGGAPIVHVEGQGVAVSFEGVSFDAYDGRAFEVYEGASLTVSQGRVTSVASRAEGAIAHVVRADLTLTFVDLAGGSADVGGQIAVVDGRLVLDTVVSTGAHAQFGGVIDARDEDGVAEVQHLLGFELRDATSGYGAGGLRTSGDALLCDFCTFVGVDGAAIVALGDVELFGPAFLDVSIGVYGRGRDGEEDALTVVGGLFRGVEVYGVSAARYASITVAESLFDDVRARAVVAESSGDVRLAANAFCDVGDESGFPAVGVADSAFAEVVNQRFVGVRSDAVVEVLGVPGAVLRHNDFLATRGAAVVVLEDDAVFEDNLLAWHVGGTLLDAPATADVGGNLWFENEVASVWTGGEAATFGFEGDPGLLGFDPATACATLPGWMVAGYGIVFGGPFPTWRYAGRDAGVGPADPDGTPSDVGAVGGPDSLFDLWIDYDDDGWPAIYDCTDDDPSVNPDVTDVPYDDLDADCDRYSDDDGDRDGFDDHRRGGDDCDDEAAESHPGAPDEPNDRVDQNCDDDFDADDDGYAWPVDCDDARPDRNPSQVEDPGGDDLDCDGNVDLAHRLGFGCDTGRTPVAFLGASAAWLAMLRRRRRDG